MFARKFGLSVISVLCVALLSACSQEVAQQRFLYEDENLKITEVMPLGVYQMGDFLWVDPTEKPLFEQVDTIVKGVVTNLREIELRYWNVDYEMVEYATLYDFRISEVFRQSDSLKAGDTVSIYLLVSSRLYPAGITQIESGGEYTLFCSKLTHDEGEIVNLDGVADYAILHPASLVIENGTDDFDASQVVEILTAPINFSQADEKYKSDLSSISKDVGLFEAFLIEKSGEY